VILITEVHQIVFKHTTISVPMIRITVPTITFDFLFN